MLSLMEGNAEAAAPESLLARSEVARILGVAPNTVARWAREGRLPCWVTLGGHHRFSRSLVEEVRDRMSCGVPVLAAPQRGK